MKKASLLFGICIGSLQLLAQPIRYASDAAPIIEQMAKSVSVKHYEGAFSQSYTFQLVADTVSNTLLKATVTDRQTNSARTYYFHNDYLIKVTEQFKQCAPVSLIHHFFFNTDYAIAATYIDEEQKALLVRQRLLLDSYKLLLYYRQVLH